LSKSQKSEAACLTACLNADLNALAGSRSQSGIAQAGKYPELKFMV